MPSSAQWESLRTPGWLNLRSRRLHLIASAVVVAVLVVAGADALFGWHNLGPSSGVPGHAGATANSRPLSFLLGGNSAPPDPLALGGWRENTTWVTTDPDAQLHHWLFRMSGKENGEEMDWARNKTVLLLGDSVLRDWIWRLCDNHLHADRKMIYWGDEPEERLGKREPNEKTHAWECVAPETGLRLVNGFLYGMTDYGRYDPIPPFLSWEWPPGPWGIEDRIPTLIEQYTPYDPEMIVLNSGPWDFKFMFKRDVYEGNKAIDIERGELDRYGERLRQCMRMLRDAFPRSKLVFLQIHAFDAEDDLPRWWWSKEMNPAHKPPVDLGVGEPNSTNIEEYLPHLFTRRRVSQLSSIYRKVTAEEGWDDLDYWKLQDNSEPDFFFRPFDAIHPSDDSIAVMLDWMLEKLWRWAVYRV